MTKKDAFFTLADEEEEKPAVIEKKVV